MQAFVLLVLVLFVSGGSLATKCVFMMNQLCMVRIELIDLNCDGHDYYPLIISIDRCDGYCNAVECCCNVFAVCRLSFQYLSN